MPYLAVDLEEGEEHIYRDLPERWHGEWLPSTPNPYYVKLPSGSIKALIGRELSWTDEPVDLEKELRKE